MPTLYAMYLQATRKQSITNKVARRQWIVLPPLTETVLRDVPGNKPDADERFLKFYREQSSPENRVKWRWEWHPMDTAEDIIPLEVKRLLTQNQNFPPDNQWVFSPVVTAQITPRELATLFAEPKTPYSLLTRFEKVARTKHHLAI